MLTFLKHIVCKDLFNGADGLTQQIIKPLYYKASGQGLPLLQYILSLQYLIKMEFKAFYADILKEKYFVRICFCQVFVKHLHQTT